MKKQRNVRPYLITSGIILGIFTLLFCVKGIYPFGNNSLIWGDMHDQVTAFYYHFYDVFHGDASLLVNFSTSGGINFLGIFAYYLLSPISFLILLFPRNDIYQAISILIAIKVLLSGLTCLYFIRTYFKKAPHYISVLLAILYAFSGYQLLLYQITAWIDIVYLFPLLLIGLKKVLDLESPVGYTLLLALCFIFSFYLAVLLVFFLFFVSFIYLYYFRPKETHKKAIVDLGISTVLALLLSCFVLLPAVGQISVSSRVGFNINTLLNSKFGALNDKLCFFITASFSIVGALLLMVTGWKKKKHKNVVLFFLTCFVLLLIPVFIEPVNKMWHLGSYAFFPLRTGFVLLFLLLIATLYYFTHLSKEKPFPKKNIIYAILITIAVVVTNVTITVCNYRFLQNKIYGISLGKDVQVAATLLIMMAIFALGIFLILWLHHFCYSKLTFTFIWILALTNILCCSFLYFGIDSHQKELTGVYVDMQEMSTSYQEDDYMRVKDLYPKLVMNNGMVTRYHTLDHFTSLTDKSNMETLKKMGYSSYWVKTYSIGGTLFSDAVLANQYLISKDPYINPYYSYVTNYGDFLFYRHNLEIPYGLMIDHDVSIMDFDNAFEIQNAIYQGITGEEDSIFTISDTPWTRKNLFCFKEKETDTFNRYLIRKNERIAYLEKEIDVKGRQNLYLELLLSIDNTKNSEILESTNIYINGKLYREKFPEEIDNGLLDLGIFEDEKVKIRIEFNKSTYFSVIEVGMLDLDRYESFVANEKLPLTIDFTRNEIHVQVPSDKAGVLFLPIAYNDGYDVTVNGTHQEVLDLFDNFLGVKVEEGDNEIVFTYTPPYFKIGCLISIVALIGMLLLYGTRLYERILSFHLLQNIAYYLYLGIYLILLVAFYIVPILGFLLSFFFYIKL